MEKHTTSHLEIDKLRDENEQLRYALVEIRKKHKDIDDAYWDGGVSQIVLDYAKDVIDIATTILNRFNYCPLCGYIYKDCPHSNTREQLRARKEE